MVCLLAAAIVSAVGASLKWLSRDGAISATIIGCLVLWLGGGQAIVPLIAFFVSSSILSLVGRQRKRTLRSYSDGDSQRTAKQVWANGGVATILVIAHRLMATHYPLEASRLSQILFLAALSTVNSDTWATEIGSLIGGIPRMLSTWKPAPPGASGAVSAMGTLAAVAGAFFVPFCVYRLWDLNGAEFVAAAWAAFLGCIADSILGAGIQAQFKDPQTGLISENAVVDSRPGVLVKGVRWIDNSAVNFISSAIGALFCWVLLHFALRNVM